MDLAVTGKGGQLVTLKPDAELGLATRVLSRAREMWGHGHPERLRRLCREIGRVERAGPLA